MALRMVQGTTARTDVASMSAAPPAKRRQDGTASFQTMSATGTKAIASPRVRAKAPKSTPSATAWSRDGPPSFITHFSSKNASSTTMPAVSTSVMRSVVR